MPDSLEQPKLIKCNRHSDCDAADEAVKVKTGNPYMSADHCHDECCEDCFGS